MAFSGKGQTRDGTDEADLHALLAGVAHGGEGDAGGGAVGDHGVLGVVHVLKIHHRLVFGDGLVLGLQFAHQRLEAVRLDVQRVDDGALAAAALMPAGGGPALVALPRACIPAWSTGSIIWPMAPSPRSMVGVRYLSATSKAFMVNSTASCTDGGGKDGHAVVAVSAAAGGLIVVRLGGLDGAEARAAADDVDDQAGKLRAGDVADALLLEGHARAGGAGHGARAGAGRAVDHVDGRDLALGLDERAAHLGQALAHILGDLALGRDGVAEIVAAAGLHGGFRDGLVALHHLSVHTHACLSTRMTQSGHIW